MSLHCSKKPFFFALLLSGLFLCACAPKAEENAGAKKKFYFDANLRFAIEVPAQWRKAEGTVSGPGDEPFSVAWESAEKDDVRMAVTSEPYAPAAEGYEELLDNFLKLRPGIEVTSRSRIELPSAPALLLRGGRLERSFMVIVPLSGPRAFTLEFSSPHESFDHFLPLFQEAAESFTILE